LDHWRESGHCYALELTTQRVWDYVRDGWEFIFVLL
jgi:BRCA1-associated protein